MHILRNGFWMVKCKALKCDQSAGMCVFHKYYIEINSLNTTTDVQSGHLRTRPEQACSVLIHSRCWLKVHHDVAPSIKLTSLCSSSMFHVYVDLCVWYSPRTKAPKMNGCIVKEPNIPGNECSPPSSLLAKQRAAAYFLQQPCTNRETGSVWWRTPLANDASLIIITALFIRDWACAFTLKPPEWDKWVDVVSHFRVSKLGKRL